MPDFRLEARFAGPVAGIDEAGRGPLAGPVVAAAVVIDRVRVDPAVLALLDDSKKLTAKRRLQAFLAIRASDAFHVGVGAAGVRVIDAINILQADFVAMRRALAALPARPVAALVDGNLVPPGLSCEGHAVVKGDSTVYAIAAASIVAKVTRDHLMSLLARRYPVYGWETNAGYGSAAHLRALEKHGVTAHHRRTFAPVARLLIDRPGPGEAPTHKM